MKPPFALLSSARVRHCSLKHALPHTQLHVWERPCGACNGSGFASSSSHRRKSKYSSTSVCMLCQGIGLVRCSSTRLLPHLGDGSGDVSGWGRSNGKQNGDGQH